MIPVKYATASQVIPLGIFVDSTDGNTEEGALTIANTDIKLWKTGTTTLANKNVGGATYISNGQWYTTLDATDTNTYGPMKIAVHVAGALAVELWVGVMNVAAYNKLYSGTGFNDLTAAQVNAEADTALADYAPNTVAPDNATITAIAGYLDTEIAAILEDTGTTIPALIAALNNPTTAAIAAAVASYDMGNGRTIKEALSFLRNKWTLSAGVLTVYDTDDTTVLWTSAVTQTAGDPVSASDPA